MRQRRHAPYNVACCPSEFYGWCFLCASVSLEVALDTEAEEVGEDVVGETANGDIILLCGFVEEATGLGNAVLSAFELSLELAELFVGSSIKASSRPYFPKWMTFKTMPVSKTQLAPRVDHLRKRGVILGSHIVSPERVICPQAKAKNGKAASM